MNTFSVAVCLLGDEMNLLRDETYRDIKKLGFTCNRDLPYRVVLYGDVSYWDVSY
jgi:hypothetical protein